MSITDELREWAHGFTGPYKSNERQLLAIADRIDEWNKADVCCEYTRGYTAGFSEASDGCEAADELRERMEREYIKMPVDADGEVIHVEDEVELLNGSKRFKAEWFEWDGEDWVVHETIGYGAYHEPSSLRHVKTDSWERIIEDAISESGWVQPKEHEIDFEDSKETRDRFMAELVERCRRLAGEDE